MDFEKVPTTLTNKSGTCQAESVHVTSPQEEPGVTNELPWYRALGTCCHSSVLEGQSASWETPLGDGSWKLVPDSFGLCLMDLFPLMIVLCEFFFFFFLLLGIWRSRAARDDFQASVATYPGELNPHPGAAETLPIPLCHSGNSCFVFGGCNKS